MSDSQFFKGFSGKKSYFHNEFWTGLQFFQGAAIFSSLLLSTLSLLYIFAYGALVYYCSKTRLPLL